MLSFSFLSPVTSDLLLVQGILSAANCSCYQTRANRNSPTFAFRAEDGEFASIAEGNGETCRSFGDLSLYADTESDSLYYCHQ